MGCPVLACAGEAVAVAESAGGVCTVTGPAAAVAIWTVAPLFASMPDASRDNESVPAVVPVIVQTKSAAPPPGMSAAAGAVTMAAAPVPLCRSAGVTESAAAWPGFATRRAAENVCCTVTCAGATAADAASCAGVSIVKRGHDAAGADTGSPSFSSVPAPPLSAGAASPGCAA